MYERLIECLYVVIRPANISGRYKAAKVISVKEIYLGGFLMRVFGLRVDDFYPSPMADSSLYWGNRYVLFPYPKIEIC